MARYKVKDSRNKKKRELLDSLGNDILRYVSELVTNSDDSYRREEELGIKSLEEPKIIYVEIREDKDENSEGDIIVVTDNAEGMSKDTLREKFEFYEDDKAGGADFNVRGLFGRGASDVLRVASHENKTAEIISIRNNEFSELKYVTDKNYNYSFDVVSIPVSEKHRKSYRIPVNGTAVSFGIPSNVKYNKNIKNDFKELMEKHPTFRYLLNQSNRKIVLVIDGKETVLSSERYSFNNMEFLDKITFTYNFQGKALDCTLKIYRNENKEIDGTEILVIDEDNVVYDNTMFDFGNATSAQNISGELVIHGLYQVCYDNLYDEDNPIDIFNVNRTGFNTKRQFYKGLNKQLSPILNDMLKKYGPKTKSANLTNNENINKALKRLNEYINKELKDTITGGNLGGQEPPREGIKFVRTHASITCGKTYDLKLLINSSIIAPTDSINIIVEENDSIEVTPSSINYLTEDVKPNGLVVKDVVIKSLQVTNEPIAIKAVCKEYNTIIIIDVIEREIHDPENGFEFYPNELVLSPEGTHKALLYYDKSIVREGTFISFDCEGLDLAKRGHLVSNKELIDENIGCIVVKSKGGKIGNKYFINAKIDDALNNLMTTVKITIAEPNKNKHLGDGLISSIKLEDSEGQYYQAYYQPYTHELIINSKNPVNIALLGPMDDIDPNEPKFVPEQRRYLCDLIASYGAQILVMENNVKNGELNIEDAQEAVEKFLGLVQQHKNNIFNDIYPVLVGKASK